MSKHRYSMMINWSDEDQAYIVSIPEFGTGAKTHGATLAKAVRMGEDLIESLVRWAEDEGRPLPDPLLFDEKSNFARNPFKSAALAGPAQPRVMSGKSRAVKKVS